MPPGLLVRLFSSLLGLPLLHQPDLQRRWITHNPALSRYAVAVCAP
jgi:hypothetical protein